MSVRVAFAVVGFALGFILLLYSGGGPWEYSVLVLLAALIAIAFGAAMVALETAAGRNQRARQMAAFQQHIRSLPPDAPRPAPPGPAITNAQVATRAAGAGFGIALSLVGAAVLSLALLIGFVFLVVAAFANEPWLLLVPAFFVLAGAAMLVSGIVIAVVAWRAGSSTRSPPPR